MYRNISYKIDPDQGWQGFIVLDTWDENGQRVRETIPHQCYLYYADSKGEFNSMFGEKLKKKYFANTGNRKRWIESHPDVKIFECLPPKMEFLQNHYYGKNHDKDFAKYPLRICYMDIEIAVGDGPKLFHDEHIVKMRNISDMKEQELSLNEVRKNHDVDSYEVLDEETSEWTCILTSCYEQRLEGFCEPLEAAFPINLITFYDSFTEKYHMYALGHAVFDDPNIVFNEFVTEADLLQAFFTDFKSFGFDAITGWGITHFDLIYIYNRLEKLFGEAVATTMSPVNSKVYKTKMKLYCDTQHYDKFQFEGITQLDYMMLYKRIMTPIDGKRSSYKLDFICEEELGHGKVKFDGNFKKLYTEDFQKFCFYNYMDVHLVVELEKKRKFFLLTRSLCNVSLIEYEKIFVSSAPVVGSIIQCGRTRNVHIPFLRYGENIDDNDEETFEGAFVKAPEKRAHRKGVLWFDIQSLYPNIMIGFNISPETYIGKIITDGVSEPYLKTKDGRITVLTKDKIAALKKNDKYCIAANGSVYSTAHEGLIPYFLKGFFNERLKLKNEAKRIDKQIKKMKKEGASAEDIKKMEDHYDIVDNEQTTRKIILNTTYGVLGSKFSMFYNLDNAEAVTLTGQAVIKHAGKFVNEYMRKLIGGHVASDYESIIYGDTDSLSLTIEKLIEFKYDNCFKDFKGILKDADDLTDSLNNWCQTTLSHELFNMFAKDRINFAREYLCDVIYLFKKKYYVLHIIEKNGERVDEFKFKGISLVKSTYPKYMKDKHRYIYMQSMKENWDSHKYQEYMDNVYDEFCTLDFDDVSIYVKCGCYKDTDKFLTPLKGTTGHAKAALFHNQLVDKLKLKNKYDYIKNDNLRTCIIRKPNDWNIGVIGFKDEIPMEFKEYFIVDYRKMFEKLFLHPLEDFCECNGWRKWDRFDKTDGSVSDL